MKRLPLIKICPSCFDRNWEIKIGENNIELYHCNDCGRVFRVPYIVSNGVWQALTSKEVDTLLKGGVSKINEKKNT